MMVRIFRHYVPTPLLLLASVEAALFFASIYAGVYIRFISEGFSGAELVGPLAPRATVFALVMMAIITALGLYEREIKEGDWSYYSRFVASFPLGFIAITFIFYAFPEIFLGRGALAIAFAFAFIASATARFVFLTLVDSDVIKRRVLVVGAGSRAARVSSLEKSEKGHNRFNLVGFIPLDGAHSSIDKARIIKSKAPLLAIAQKYQVDEIVVGVRQRRGGNLPMGELLECRMEGITVVELSTFFERETGKVQLESLSPSWLIFSEGFDRGNFRNFVKRLFDVVISAVMLALTAPIMLITALLIKIDSPGPVFFRQTRVGECGKPFDVYKFRSMRADAEKDGKPQWAKKKDSRVTRIGRIIRSLRIDELPQIFNVMKGDMSLVGPRPERPYFVRQLIKEIPYYSTRHSVKPGITGWAQIRYSYGASVHDAKEKLQYDLYYVKNHTLFLDLIILFQTAQVVLFGRGAR